MLRRRWRRRWTLWGLVVDVCVDVCVVFVWMVDRKVDGSDIWSTE